MRGSAQGRVQGRVHTCAMLGHLHLRTPDLLLRPIAPSDRADLVALEADPLVMRYLNGGQKVPHEGLPDADFLTPRGYEPEVMAAQHAQDGSFVGWFALFDDGIVEAQRTAEIGYRLARPFWGRGYATQGVLALAHAAFDTLGFTRIRAETMAANTASRRVLEKAGFRYVKTIYTARSWQLDGGPQGEVVYALAGC
jgi:RimJ/RimL family protein N-acetyltransferase